MAEVNSEGRVFITGGGGYVGSALVPSLLDAGYAVKVADTFWYGEDVFGSYGTHANLERVRMDIRDTQRLKKELGGTDVVIHLACISNDPSYDLNPDLGRSINYDAFIGLLEGASENRVRRFIYASSSSVYGVKEEPDVREDTAPEPLTDYSRFKLECEKVLMNAEGPMGKVVLRPATVCGYAPRLRLDLTVNILTIHALVNRRIRIFGGKQLRPNINILDMVRAYETILKAPAEKIDGEIFNVGYENRSVEDIAGMVRECLDDSEIELQYEHSDDVRSYHVNSEKIGEVLGFEAKYTIEDAIKSIERAYAAGKLQDPMNNTLYYNIKRMKELSVQ